MLIEKRLPHNFLAEKMILNCLLISSESIEITIRVLPIEAFYFQNHQEIYRTIIFMYKNQLSIDILSLITFLQDKGILEKIGGIKVLIDLINQIPNITYLEDYISLVKEKFLRRSLIKLGYNLVNSSYITNSSIENIVNDFEEKLFTLTTEMKSRQLFSGTELLKNLIFELKERSLTPNLAGITSGFNELDALTQGFQKSDFIILAGRPSTGKTALSLNISLNILKTLKLPVLFFSLEMSKEQIMYRLVSIETNLDQMKLRGGKLSQKDWIKINKVVRVISTLPIFVADIPNLTVSEVRSKIKTLIFEQSQIGLVIIDYLQLMQSSKSKNENRVQELSEITRDIKKVAREFNIPILTLSQLSRNVENRINQRPKLSDLRESGSIEQDADLVLMLNKRTSLDLESFDEINNSEIELIISKQRNGPLGNIKLQFNLKGTKFLNHEF